MRDAVSDARHAEEVLLGFFNALRNSCRNLASLAIADPDETVAVTNYD